MNDHYHHAQEISGVADDRHGHAPRDIGAAEEHDLNMLERRVQFLESEVAGLQRHYAGLASDYAALAAEIGRSS